MMLNIQECRSLKRIVDCMGNIHVRSNFERPGNRCKAPGTVKIQIGQWFDVLLRDNVRIFK